MKIRCYVPHCTVRSIRLRDDSWPYGSSASWGGKVTMPSSPAMARISIMLRGDLESTPDTNSFTSPIMQKRVSKRWNIKWKKNSSSSTVYNQGIKCSPTYQFSKIRSDGFPVIPHVVHLQKRQAKKLAVQNKTSIRKGCVRMWVGNGTESNNITSKKAESSSNVPQYPALVDRYLVQYKIGIYCYFIWQWTCRAHR